MNEISRLYKRTFEAPVFGSFPVGSTLSDIKLGFTTSSLVSGAKVVVGAEGFVAMILDLLVGGSTFIFMSIVSFFTTSFGFALLQSSLPVDFAFCSFEELFDITVGGATGPVPLVAVADVEVVVGILPLLFDFALAGEA